MPRVVERVFLGWGSGAAAPIFAAAEAIATRFRSGDAIDMGDARVVVPGGRAKRLLLGALVARAEALGAALVPPSIHTPSEVATVSLGGGAIARAAGLAPASPVARRLAWMGALRSLAPGTLAVLAPRAPGADDAAAWSALADMLERASDALAGGLLRFEGVPARAEVAIPGFGDSRRLSAAAAAQGAYEASLRRAGLCDDALARIDALNGAQGGGAQPIVLVGVADLNEAARAALHSHAGPVTAMVVAPASLAERFDDLGLPITRCWIDADPGLREEQVVFAGDGADQADAAIGAAAALGGAYSPGELVLGVADPALLPLLRRRWPQATEVPLRSATGLPLIASAPARLLARLAEYLEDRSFAAFAALVRHPDMEAWLTARVRTTGGVEGWLDAIDRAAADRAPAGVGPWLFDHGGDDGGDDPSRPPLALWRAAVDLTGPLLGAGPAPERRPLTAWALPLLEALRDVYESASAPGSDDQRATLAEACERVRDALLSIDAAGSRGITGPPVHASGAARFALEAMRHETVPEPASAGAVEALGWLELPLDPARACIVVGMHEGVVPRSGVADPLLPDALRRALGIDHDERRLARDAFHLATLAGAKERLTLIAGRVGPGGEPNRPSRLLFLGEERAAIRRARRFADPSRETGARARAATIISVGPIDASAPSLAVAPAPMDVFAVTWFKDFLASPRLFYLRRALRLEERDDSARELDPMRFGVVIHDALLAFARSDERASADEREITRSLDAALATLSRERFGDSPSAPVRLQLEFARRRLRAFATFQAERRRQGWVIEQAEWSPRGEPGSEPGVPFDPGDGPPARLIGKIDRVDRHEDTGAFAILDYKTGDEEADPRAAHGPSKAGVWTDLQLPLYRHLAREIVGDAAPALGYITLGRSARARLRIATAHGEGEDRVKKPWTAGDLLDADDKAREIIRKVRSGEMDGVGDRPPTEGPLAALCKQRALGGAGDGLESDDRGDEPAGEDA